MTCTCSLLCRFHITGTSARRQRSAERTGSHFLAPAGILEKTMKAFTVAATALAVLPRMAWAHHFMDGGLPETFAQGLLSGLGHPVIGLDHAAFILAAGFFLALVEGGMWGIPALIVGTLIGAALHLAGFALPGAEFGVALSVVLIGGLVMVRHEVKLSLLAGGLAP